MGTRFFIIGIALILMLAGAISAAEAKTRHVHCKGGGTFIDGVETHLDTNGDGVSAGTDQGLENCTIEGRLLPTRFLFQEEAEWIRQTTVTTCPAGTTDEFHIDSTQGQERAVATDEKTGDQLFGRFISATLCINFSSFPTPPFPFTVSGQGENIGGTGKYAGATGPYTFRTVGSYLIFGFKDDIFGALGQFTFTTDGTLTLPNDD
jgi:hypothetical protein